MLALGTTIHLLLAPPIPSGRSSSARKTCRESRTEMRGENWGNLRKSGERLKGSFPSVHAVFIAFSRDSVLG
jgi:hypothetical protein